MTLKHEKTKKMLHLVWYMLLWLHPLTSVGYNLYQQDLFNILAYA